VLTLNVGEIPQFVVIVNCKKGKFAIMEIKQDARLAAFLILAILVLEL
jgi:hypothetical protein